MYRQKRLGSIPALAYAAQMMDLFLVSFFRYDVSYEAFIFSLLDIV